MQCESQEYLLVDMTSPLAQFRSVKSGIPPFLTLLRHLERATGLELGFPDVAISPADFAGLRHETLKWAEARHRLGLDTELTAATIADLLGVQGFNAPFINPKLRPGDALVARRFVSEVA